jgi:hypothetical protein
MERRGFLKTLAAGAAMIMLPSLATSSTPPRVFAFPMKTAEDLAAWMQNNFKCFISEPRSFIEVLAKDVPKIYGFRATDMPGVSEDDEIVRFIHKTVAYAIEGDDPVEAERRLALAIYEKLDELKAQTPVIIRTQPEFTSEPMIEYGETWMTREQIEDRVDIPILQRGELVATDWSDRQDKWWMEKYWRKPEIINGEFPPIQIPEGVEHDFETDSLKYVNRKYRLNKMRMRISLPTVLDEDQTIFNMAEGEKTPRI